MTSNPSNGSTPEVTGRSRPARRAGSDRHSEPEPVVLFHPDARRLARAATDIDNEVILQLVRASIDAIGVVSTWERLVQPVWLYLRSRTDAYDKRTACEHVYVQSAMTALSEVRQPPRRSPPSVLLACADEEFQVFPLEAMVAALEESGVPCCVLGARVPPHALASAATSLCPAVVIVWSQTGETADPAQIAIVLKAYPATTIIAAGPGWNTANLPPQTVRPTSLSNALVLTLAALEGRTANTTGTVPSQR